MSVLNLLLALSILSSANSTAANELLTAAIEQFDGLTTYQVTLHSYGNAEQVLRYRYKKPGYVRIDFVKPHRGAALVYRPDTGYVELRPFASLKFLTFTLRPTSALVRSPSGHRVDQSDIGVLLRSAQELARQGESQILREERRLDLELIVLEITGAEQVTVDGVGRYLLWLDKQSNLPRVVESYDRDGGFIEGLILEDLEIDPPLKGDFEDL